MSWVTIVWSMTAAACATLAGMHLLVWIRQKATWENLLFASSALAAAAMAGFELALMRSRTTEEFGVLLRWGHLPFAILIISIVWFMRFHFRAGQPWLAWAVTGTRMLALILNFIFIPNLNFLEITGLRQLHWWGGETVSVPIGLVNPWTIIGHLSQLFLIIFCIDATIIAWRRGDQRQSLVVGGSAVLFISMSLIQTVLVVWGVVPAPFFFSIAFLGILLSMGYELSRDVLLAAQLSRQVQSGRALTDAVFDSVPGILYLYAADGRLLRWNRQHETLLGYSGQELTQINVTDFFEGTDLAAMKQVWQRVFSGEHVTVELTVKIKGGTKVPYLLTGVRLEINGEPHLVGIGFDLTQHRQTELEVSRQRNELAHLSRVTMLGELSGSMAHELNQPLTSILSNAQAAQRFLAHDNVDLAELRAILADIVEEDIRAGEIIHRLRLLLKKGEVQRHPLDLNEVVQDVVKMVRNDLMNQGVTAYTELTPALPVVKGDRVQLQQVLLNLVLNACDAMNGNANPDRHLFIRTETSVDSHVIVSVSDRGEGIPADKLEEVFQPFYTTKPHGLGLGLVVCRSIITAHGGKLWAVNSPERGATFNFTLPVAL